ncbi:schwannomin-interacting protein 1 isoform X2 [Channa argus]|uniref:schwannomin-interacting protein 1 isoform X2 n=1 Tax=Channa argus TaxID=215402 RepID=UPI003521AA74
MEKERQRQQWEEKESNEEEGDNNHNHDADDEEEEDCEDAALVWQTDYSEDNLGLPIMHWEALSLRIAELEKQEEEKKAKRGVSLEQSSQPVSWTDDRKRRGEKWEEGEGNSNLMALTSCLQTQMNLQLCFINNSESEEEEKEKGIKKESPSTKKGDVQVYKNPQPDAKPETPKSRGFRTLWNLRDRLKTNNKVTATAYSDPVVQKKHLERSDLQNFSIKELNGLCKSLSQTIQELSSELVGRLQVRDQLRTEQDAMLLEVQDLTSVGT